MPRWLKFSAVGAIGIGVQLAALAFFHNGFGIQCLAATAMAVETPVLHNFLWHERFTWPERRTRHFAARLGRFHAGNGLVSLLGNTFLMYCFVDRLKAPPALSTAAAIALCSIANFLIADRWVYADSTPP